jgi:hypothetical protein
VINNNNNDDFDGEDVCEAIMEMRADIHKLTQAFPGSDTDGHRRYHEIQIEKVAEMRRLRVAIQEKTISGLIWAGVLWLFSIGVHNFQEWIKGVIH